MPAGRLQPRAHDITAALIHRTHLFHALLRPFQRNDRGHLDRRKGPVVVITLHTRQCVDEIAIADHTADAPARHVVTLRERKKLNGDIPRAGHFHDRRRTVAIKHDVGIGQVMHDINVVLARNRHQTLEKRQINTLRRRIAGKITYQHLRLRITIANGALELVEEINTRHHRHMANIGAGNHRTIDMDGITGIRHQHNIALIERRQCQVGNALLRADGDDRFRIRIKINAIARLVPVTNGASQARNTLGNRITVGVGPLHAFDQLVDNMLRRRLIRVAHRKVDDVFAALAGGRFQFTRNVENIGRQAFDPGELFHRLRLFVSFRL